MAMMFPIYAATVCFLGSAYGRHLTQAPIYGRKVDDSWRKQAIQKLWDERHAMGRTPISHLSVPGIPEVDLIFKNESASRTGNLKHRFSWALFMWALIEGYINENTTIYEASSGNTAASEAYMARLIGVPFVAVCPNTTEDKKLERVTQYGGRFIKTEIGQHFARAKLEAQVNNGFYMNQFANADRAEEFHQSNGESKESTNVFHEVLTQLKEEGLNAPSYFVHSAGTGGTISSIGRYVKKYLIPTEVVLADSEFSIYYDFVVNKRFQEEGGEHFWMAPGIAGTGFGYSGPAIHGISTSLQPSVIDLAFKIPDLAATAAMHFLKKSGISAGTSTGLNFFTALTLASQKRNSTNFNLGDKLRIVVLLADGSAPYEDTYYNNSWIENKFYKHGGLHVLKCWEKVIAHSFKHGDNPLDKGSVKCKKSKDRRRHIPF